MVKLRCYGNPIRVATALLREGGRQQDADGRLLMAGWTVQAMIDNRMTVRASCRNNHVRRIDLDVLKERLGPQAAAMAADLIPRLICSSCGEQAIGMTYSPNTKPARMRV